MKGLANVKSFLSSGKPLSKDSLPACDIDRDALIHVMWELYKENASLKAKVAGEPLNSAGAASPSNAEGTPLNAAGTSVPSNAAGDTTPKNATELNAATPTFVPAAQNANGNTNANTRVNTTAEPEREECERLCRSMWGYKECPRTNGQ